MNTGMIRLRAKVKGLAEAGCWTRRQIQKNVEERRSEWWRVKRAVGSDARHHLIAYGLLRGRPYGAIERRCGEKNAPSPAAVHAIIQEHGDWKERRDWTLEKVQAALDPDQQAKVAAERPEPVREKPERKGLLQRAVDFVRGAGQ